MGANGFNEQRVEHYILCIFLVKKRIIYYMHCGALVLGKTWKECVLQHVVNDISADAFC